MKLPKLQKLNMTGLSHHVLIAVLVISGVAGFGAWRVFNSSAATNYAGMCGTGYTLKATKSFTYGKILVYVKGKGAGSDWCSYTVRTGKASGVRDYTRSFLLSDPSNGATWRGDSGNYAYYAGPSKWSNASKMRFDGMVKYKGVNYSQGSQSWDLTN